MAKDVSISDENWAWLQSLASPLEDSVDDVLSRLRIGIENVGIETLDQAVGVPVEISFQMARDRMPAPNTSWQSSECLCPGAMQAWFGFPPQYEGWEVGRWRQWHYPMNPDCPVLDLHVFDD